MVVHVNDTGTDDLDVHLLEYIDSDIDELTELVKDHRVTYAGAAVDVLKDQPSAYAAALAYCRANRGYLVCHGFVMAAGMVPVHHAWVVDTSQSTATEVYHAAYANEKYFGRAMTVEEYTKLNGNGPPDWAFALLHHPGAPAVQFEPIPDVPAAGTSFRMMPTRTTLTPEEVAIADEMAAAAAPPPMPPMQSVVGAAFPAL